MKTPNMKVKVPDINLAKRLPYIFIALFLIVGLSMVAFGYFLLNRSPDESVVKNMQGEISGLSAKFDKQKISKLFDATYDTSNVKIPAYKTKDPFQSF